MGCSAKTSAAQNGYLPGRNSRASRNTPSVESAKIKLWNSAADKQTRPADHRKPHPKAEAEQRRTIGVRPRSVGGEAVALRYVGGKGEVFRAVAVWLWKLEEEYEKRGCRESQKRRQQQVTLFNGVGHKKRMKRKFVISASFYYFKVIAWG